MFEGRLHWGDTLLAIHWADKVLTVGERGDLYLPEEILGARQVEITCRGEGFHTWGDFVLVVREVKRERLPRGSLCQSVERRELASLFASTLLHGLCFGLFSVVLPNLVRLSPDEIASEKISRMRAYLDAANARHAADEPPAELEHCVPIEVRGGGGAPGSGGATAPPKRAASSRTTRLDPREMAVVHRRELADAERSTMAELVDSEAEGIAARGPVFGAREGGCGATTVGESAPSLDSAWQYSTMVDSSAGGGFGLGTDTIRFGNFGHSFGRGSGTYAGPSRVPTDSRVGVALDFGAPCRRSLRPAAIGASARAPKMHIDELVVDGALSRELVHRGVRRGLARFAACVDTENRSAVAIKFVVDRGGSVAIVDDTDNGNAAARACIVKRAYALSFDTASQNAVTRVRCTLSWND